MAKSVEQIKESKIQHLTTMSVLLLIGILSAFTLYKRGNIVKNEWSEHEKKIFMEKCVEGSYGRKEHCICVMHKLMKNYILDKPVDAAGIDEAVSECLYEN